MDVANKSQHQDTPGEASTDHISALPSADTNAEVNATANAAAQCEGSTSKEQLRDDQEHGNGADASRKNHELNILCGPLLNYKGMTLGLNNKISWLGSVLIVTKTPTLCQPTLEYHGLGDVQVDGVTLPLYTVVGVKLYEDQEKAFYRFSLSVPMLDIEAEWQYAISGANFKYESSLEDPGTRNFFVPSITQSMRIMFYSCNGFSVGTDKDAYSGPGGVLWKDVMRQHQKKPIHVMIGGGDQIYNDSIRVDNGPLEEWTNIGNLLKRRNHQFPANLRDRCDKWYYDNYKGWYSLEPFAIANAQIPQINVWDDHDIIDGFGSYTDRFMRCPVFRGIGSVAHKYYCLFQHHCAPPKSTFTTDFPQPTGKEGKKTFVFEETSPDTSVIVGPKPGPYVEECSRSLYMQLGARIAFVGIDARTERTRHQINYPETYNIIFERLNEELKTNDGAIKHLIVLLGVPIAYPRLNWLENIFSSPIIGPMRFLNRRFGFAGNVFNKFDGQVDLLDDLDDHYTARLHKKERREFIQRLQRLAVDRNVRVTILGGDVHLCAIGRFYSQTRMNIPVSQDPRYMANIISSAITNKPPPAAIANLLSFRNKIHHLDNKTDETLMEIFDKDPGDSKKTARNNHVTMPSRNYAIIQEIAENLPQRAPQTNGITTNDHATQSAPTAQRQTEKSNAKNAGHGPLHSGEENAGTKHAAATGLGENSGETRIGDEGGLSVCLKVEIDSQDPEGTTEGYGFSIPKFEKAPK